MVGSSNDEVVMKKISLCLLATVLLGFNRVAYGAGRLININFGEYYNGAAATGKSGDQWNNLKGSDLRDYNYDRFERDDDLTPIDLISSKGGLPVAQMTAWHFDGISNIDPSVNAFVEEGTSLPGYGLMTNYNYENGGDADESYITISGLAAGTYKVYVYSQSELETINPKTVVTVNDIEVFTIPEVENTESSFVLGKNYYTTEISLVSGENLRIGFTNTSDEELSKAAINGIQIEAVPEPGVVMLLGVGALFSLFTMREKSVSSNCT